MTETLNTTLSGIRFAQRQEVIRSLSIGASVTAWREPDNPYDINAIRVDCRAGSIGYLPQELAAQLSPRLDAVGVRELEGRVIRLFADETQDGAFNAEVRFTLPAALQTSTGEAPRKPVAEPQTTKEAAPQKPAAPSQSAVAESQKPVVHTPIQQPTPQPKAAAQPHPQQQNKGSQQKRINPYWIVAGITLMMLCLAGLLMLSIMNNPYGGLSESAKATEAAALPPVLPPPPPSFDTT